MIYLVRGDGNTWKLQQSITSTTYDSIELASEVLVNECGISDDEIDLALISIYANGHIEASFDEGKFKASV